MNSAKADAAAPAAFKIKRNSEDRPKDPPRYEGGVENWELDCGALLLTGTIQASAPHSGRGWGVTLHIFDKETTVPDAANIICDYYAQAYSIQVARLAPQDIYIDDSGDGLVLIFTAGIFNTNAGTVVESLAGKPSRLA